ncbi:MAG: hypothetical protein ABEJ71_01945 [Halodesulfurarchaeum sp.]
MQPRSGAVLVFAAMVVLAGCTGAPSGSTTTVPPTETTRATPTATPTSTIEGLRENGYANAFTFRATPVSPETIAKDVATPLRQLDDDRRRIAEATLATNSSTVTYMSHGLSVPETPGPLEAGEYLSRNGTFYRIEATVVKQWNGTGYQVEMEGPLGNREREGDVPDNVTEFASLSPVGKDLFSYGAPSMEERKGALISSGFHYLPKPTHEVADAALLDGTPHYVRHEGDVFRVQVTGERPPVVRMQIRYELVQVARSPEAFIDGRLSGLVATVTDEVPPEPGRSIILSALENGSYRWSGTVETRPERVEAADAWIAAQPPSGSFAYLRDNGTLYKVSVTEVIE